MLSRESVDVTDAENHFRGLLHAMGLNPAEEHLLDTPRRYIGMLSELFFEEPWKFTTFENPDGDSGIVVVRDIPFTSLCAHHFALFTGTATVAYIPNQRLVGLSKLARAVQMFAKGPNVQEFIGRNTVNFLEAHLEPIGVAVILKATHTCMTERGVKAHGSETITSTLRGCFLKEPSSRAELMSLLEV